ncbi:MAG: hypothetical protein GWO20_05640 [Candidatus Korarchaeota archaeon]|nr:hypothetical protein [Candidatus Korarchaeota archaeon]NIU82925.1 hypothetical protein [Candidatus Thorarchaeota archaeon]NIW13353.1 hypothetical protein [Candidatus Thorarchaeota archaeon]NIW51453.1 hypothetical protein [Candidatus Korarchaeota archaeon]
MDREKIDEMISEKEGKSIPCNKIVDLTLEDLRWITEKYSQENGNGRLILEGRRIFYRFLECRNTLTEEEFEFIIEELRYVRVRKREHKEVEGKDYDVCMVARYPYDTVNWLVIVKVK